MSFRSALSDEESEAEALRKTLSNNAEELEMMKHELQDKITTLAETQGELESLRNLVSDNQTQSNDVQQELLNTRDALAESEALVKSLNESLTENSEEVKELQRFKEALMKTQSVLGKHTILSQVPNTLHALDRQNFKPVVHTLT